MKRENNYGLIDGIGCSGVTNKRFGRTSNVSHDGGQIDALSDVSCICMKETSSGRINKLSHD